MMKDLKVDYIETEKEFKNYAEAVWSMLNASYTKLGGLKSYAGFRSFKRKQPFLKVVDYEGLKACASYNETTLMGEQTYKMTAIGCDQTKIGKDGLKLIVKDDIHSNDYRFWVEASGRIEYYFEKFGGYKVHNIYASFLLHRQEQERC